LSDLQPHHCPEWQELLNLGKLLLEQPGLSAQCEMITATAQRLLDCQATLWLLEPLFSVERPGNISGIIDAALKAAPTPLLKRALETRDLVLDDDHASTALALPLITHGEVLGAIQLKRLTGKGFVGSEIDFIKGLAIQATIALQSTRQRALDHWRVELLSLVRNVSAQIAAVLDLDELARRVTNLILDTFHYYYVAIFTVEPAQEALRFRDSAGPYSTGGNPVQTNDRSPVLRVKIGDGIIGYAAQAGEEVLVGDVQQDPRYRHLDALPETKAEFALPLKVEGRVLGVLDVQSDQANAFHEIDALVLRALADNIATALHNANLYRSNDGRRQVADSMREVAGLLSADVALDQVYERILTELERSLPCDVVAIWLLDTSGADEGLGQFTSPLRLAATHHRFAEQQRAEDGQTDGRLFSIGVEELMNSSSPPETLGSWIMRALEATNPITRTPEDPYEPLGSLLNFPEDYSAIAAPLRIGDQTLGLLVLAHQTPGRYGTESEAMTATFASYAAVAIENTRLYEVAHDQAWVSTVLLQVAEATQSLASLEELLETVVHIIPQLIGVNACALLLWDNTIDAFVPMAAYGLTPVQQASFELWFIAAGDIWAFDQLLSTKAPVILSNELTPDPDSSMLFSGFEPAEGLLVIFPMIVQAEVRGAILVDFRGANFKSVHELWDEKFAIIQGIAHQTMTAAENIQLLQAQEEEAYVSVALLQVAQAVVGSSDLDDVMAAVVRITPILVGVKRCVIYLWDDQRSIFRLSQAYGVSRPELSEMPEIHAQGKFPLLDAVHQSNRIAYFYAGDTPLAPLVWNQLEADNFALVAEKLSDESLPEGAGGDPSKDYLRKKSRLFFGLPLSVKDKVLGVMLIEEEDSVRGIPSFHIREKRLEIVTGITQQAALAIQNDLLQREVVERERLEREMQLAREIQKTFLPERLPALKGWDLDIHWFPARQVGGDFYDVFELGDGQLGLVIADVADKGMPAALFMTLVRTLIRAAIKEEYSPASVLARVNDLLVPDAKQGMFVTVVYAVISLSSGLLCYANAGHNPPLIRRAETGEFEELKRSGMALGVLEGIELAEKQIQLQPNDFILFYTDGLTEAFSPREELYGVERLRHTLLNLGSTETASSVIEKIETSVNTFVQGMPRSDDLTLAVLIRKG
jgi:serine phosphatase RsbU (regulator of sigma subunit)/putative methionine-R-sulfoxide reductase with GAF domain